MRNEKQRVATVRLAALKTRLRPLLGLPSAAGETDIVEAVRRLARDYEIARGAIGAAARAVSMEARP